MRLKRPNLKETKTKGHVETGFQKTAIVLYPAEIRSSVSVSCVSSQWLHLPVTPLRTGARNWSLIHPRLTECVQTSY